MSARTRRRSRMSVRYFDDRILLTETHAWAYYRLPTHAYEFLTPSEREGLAINITVALSAIRLPDTEVHLRVAHRAYPAAEWAARLDATSDDGPGWRDYLDEMYRHVWAKDFWTKEVYLGVRLGQRGMRAQLSGGMSPSSSTPTGPASRRWDSTTRRCRPPRSAGGPSRPSGWAARWPAARWPRGMPPAPRSRGCSGMLWPGRTVRRLPRWCGGGSGGRARSRPSSRAGAQRPDDAAPGAAGQAFAAFLSFSRFPDVMSFPDGEPWLHFADSLPFPVEISSRMKLISRPRPARTWACGWRMPGTWTRTSARPGSICRWRWPSSARRPGCSSTASPRSGCRLSTAGTVSAWPRRPRTCASGGWKPW